MADPKARARLLSAAATASSQSTSPPALLHSPWLRHELFAATKRAASTPDGLALAKKSAVAKVAQELKRSRNYLDQQLRELESQLLNVTDYLNGTRTTVYTDRGLPDLTEASASDASHRTSSSNAAAAAAVVSAGRGDSANGLAPIADALPASPNTAGLRSKFVQHHFPGAASSSDTSTLVANAMGIAVEDDLASDTPCTTVGLWKYAAAYGIFRDVTADDVAQTLQLEDPTPAPLDDTDDALFAADYKPSADATEQLAKHVLGAASGSLTDDFMKARLVAALVPVPEPERADTSAPSSPLAVKTEASDAGASGANGKTEDKPRAEKSAAKRAPKVESWSAQGVTAALRDVGLIECSDSELHKRVLRPGDDEVSCELRDLQLQLRDHVRQTNETKRKLRTLLQSTKPWLSTQAAANQAIEKQFLTMWRRKKELERKKMLKDKKLMRRDALRSSGSSSHAIVQLP